MKFRKVFSKANFLKENLRTILILILSFIYLILIVMSLFQVYPSASQIYYDKDGNVIRNKISFSHPLGTNQHGYDYLSWLIYGWKTTFFSACFAALFFLIFGIAFGILIGYYKNIISKIIENIFNVINSFPILLLLLLLVFVFNAYLHNVRSDNARFLRDIEIYIYLSFYGLLCSPKLAEIIKSRINSLKDQDFILASKSLGLSNSHIIVKNILWYESKELIVAQLAYILAEGIFIEITLAYFQYSVRDSWGCLLYDLYNLSNATAAFYIILFFVGITPFYFYYLSEKVNEKYKIRKVYI